MPVVEYGHVGANIQRNNPPAGVQKAMNNVCRVRNSRRDGRKSLKVPCRVCLNHHPAVGSEAPLRRERFRPATPLYASQVPTQADYLRKLLLRYPVTWQGRLAIKNDRAAVQMHFLFGNQNLARNALPFDPERTNVPLRIVQRMRMEPVQLEDLAKKMQIRDQHCILFALPCGRDHFDVLLQAANLKAGFIMYFQEKHAAGIVNLGIPGCQQAIFVVHVIPPCEFADNTMARIAPDLLHRINDVPHVLVIIATV